MQKLLKPNVDWEVKKLGDFLDYLQPTEFLVSDTEYSDNNQTPVLTAGKTFILGYTNEEHGVFTKLPTIIFDDFTTAIKFVNFPFKAKSSAMKMLIPNNSKVNMRFIYGSTTNLMEATIANLYNSLIFNNLHVNACNININDLICNYLGGIIYSQKSVTFKSITEFFENIELVFAGS